MTEWTPKALHSLNQILASLYYEKEASVQVITSAGLDRTRIAFKDQASLNWFNILEYAKNQNKINAIIEYALEEFPENDALKRAQNGAPPPPVPAPDIKDASWQGPDGPQLEKIIGKKSTLVDVSYLQRGVARSRSVLRIVTDSGSSGSGFLTANNLVVTNNHVLKNAEAARSALIQFNYQKTVDGLDAQIETGELDPDDYFKTSVEDDWTIVRIKGNPEEKWGVLELSNIAVEKGDHVNIIQHAGGGPKQISISANAVAYVGEGRVQYLTDTLPGSSGSPVFDEQWNVVALHHSGGWLAEPNSASKTTYYRNEGISIDRVIAGGLP